MYDTHGSDAETPASSTPNPAKTPDVQQASALEQADVKVGAKLASQRDTPLVKAAGFAGKIGDQGPLYALSGCLVFLGISARDRRLTGSGIAMLAAIAVADLGKSLTKRFVHRTRPHVLLDSNRYEAASGGSKVKPEQSFPSGHTAGSVAVARALSRNFPAAGAGAGVAALAVGATRIAKGSHWPLDILAGAVIGLVAEEFTSTMLELAVQHQPEAIPDECVPIFRKAK